MGKQRKQRDQDRPAHPRSQTTASAVINIRNLRTSISPESGQRKPDQTARTDGSGSDVIKYVYMNGNGSRLDGGGGGGEGGRWRGGGEGGERWGRFGGHIIYL